MIAAASVVAAAVVATAERHCVAVDFDVAKREKNPKSNLI